MESSIAEFVERQLACELLPTESRQDQALKLVKCFGHLKRGWECACLANQQKKFRVCGFQQVSHAVVCMFQAHQSKAVVCMFQAQSCSELKLHMLRHVTHRVCGFQQVGHAVVCACSKHIRVMQWLQRSLHSAPIFRLLLKVAVNGTHQCDSHNFWGALSSNKQTHKQRTNCCRRNRVGLLLLNPN